MLTIIIESSLKAVAEEIQVETIVLLERLLPTNIRVVLDRLVCTCYRRGSLNGTRLCVTEEITIGICPVAVIIGQAIAARNIWIGKIHESDSILGLIITNETPRCTDLEERCHLGNWLPELLLAENPSHRTCWKDTEASAWCKVLRAVVTHVELCHIAAGIIVSNTTHKTHVRTWHIWIRSVRIVILLRLVVKEQSINGMLIEYTGIVEATLQIPVTSLSLRCRIRRICIIANLTIYDIRCTISI